MTQIQLPVLLFRGVGDVMVALCSCGSAPGHRLWRLCACPCSHSARWRCEQRLIGLVAVKRLADGIGTPAASAMACSHPL